MLQRGAPKLGKDGKPMKDKHGKVIYEPYRIKVLNTINFKKSMHYNPFAYIHSEKDILKLVTTLIANTKGEGKAGDDFWVKAETLLYCALIGYIHYEAPVEEQNFSTLIEFINAMEVREDDEEFKNPVDLMFDALESEKPNHFAVRQYKKYKLAAGVVCSKRLLNQAVGKSLRTHNLKPKKGAQVMRKNEKITALYERLSRDDFGKDDDQQRESNSISNQKAMSYFESGVLSPQQFQLYLSIKSSYCHYVTRRILAFDRPELCTKKREQLVSLLNLQISMYSHKKEGGKNHAPHHHRKAV